MALGQPQDKALPYLILLECLGILGLNDVHALLIQDLDRLVDFAILRIVVSVVRCQLWLLKEIGPYLKERVLSCG